MSNPDDKRKPVLLRADWEILKTISPYPGQTRYLYDKVNSACYGDNIILRLYTKNCYKRSSDINVIIKDAVTGEVVAPLEDEKKIKLKYLRNGVFQKKIKIDPKWYSRADKGAEAAFYFCISGKVKRRGKVYEFNEEQIFRKQDYLKVKAPLIIDGEWLNIRNYKEPYKMEDPYHHATKKDKKGNKIHFGLPVVAYGIKALIRFKVQNLSSNIKKMNVKVLEEDLFFDDEITEVTATRKKSKGSFAIYEASVLITKSDFFDKSGSEKSSEFYFIPQIDFEESTIKKKLPVTKEKYLHIKSPGKTINEQVLEIAEVYLLKNDYFKRKYVHADPNNREGWGIPESIYYKGVRIASLPKDITTYCSGFTFWVATRILQSNNAFDEIEKRECEKLVQNLKTGKAPRRDRLRVEKYIKALEEATVSEIDRDRVIRFYVEGQKTKIMRKAIVRFKDYFFGRFVTSQKYCAEGIPWLKVGREIVDKDDWRAGDFVQLNYKGWSNKTQKMEWFGHSVIFINWLENKRFLTYLSTQGRVGVNYKKANGGINYKKTGFKPDGKYKWFFDKTYAGRIELKGYKK